MSEDGVTFNRRAVRPIVCLREGWQLIKDDYWLFMAMSLCAMFLGSLVPFGILLGPMMCGIYLCLFNREAGRPVSFDLLFKGFNYFAQSLIAVLMLMAPLMLFFCVFYSAFFGFFIAGISRMQGQPNGGPPDPAAIRGFVAVYFALIVGIMVISTMIGALFLFAFPLIVDRKLSGFEAVKLSARAALGNFWGIVGFMLLSNLLGMLSQLACCVGVYFLYPVIFAMVATAYRQVFPADGSRLFEDDEGPPPGWPRMDQPSPGTGAGPEQTGIKGMPESVKET